MPLYRAELLAKKPLRYAALIHDVSQVLYLPFDYDDGSYARDRSGYQNHGTIYGATLATGKIGMSRSFDGVDDYVKVIRDISLEPESLTVSVWIKPKGTGDWLQNIVHKEDYAAALGYRLMIYTDKRIGFGAHDGTTRYYATVAAITVWDVWYYLTGVYDKDAKKMKVYLNGDLKREIDGPAAISHDTVRDVLIGGTPGERFNGIIDEVRIYNRALSDDEIRMLMYRRLV